MTIRVSLLIMYLLSESRVHFDRVELCTWLAELVIDRLAFMATSHKQCDLFVHVPPEKFGGYLLIRFVPTQVATCALIYNVYYLHTVCSSVVGMGTFT